jgi:hypothetical protein
LQHTHQASVQKGLVFLPPSQLKTPRDPRPPILSLGPKDMAPLRLALLALLLLVAACNASPLPRRRHLATAGWVEKDGPPPPDPWAGEADPAAPTPPATPHGAPGAWVKYTPPSTGQRIVANGGVRVGVAEAGLVAGEAVRRRRL